CGGPSPRRQSLSKPPFRRGRARERATNSKPSQASASAQCAARGIRSLAAGARFVFSGKPPPPPQPVRRQFLKDIWRHPGGCRGGFGGRYARVVQQSRGGRPFAPRFPHEKRSGHRPVRPRVSRLRAIPLVSRREAKSQAFPPFVA